MEKRNNKKVSRYAWKAAAQNNHQYPWEDHFHAMEQEKTGVAALLYRQKARLHI